MHQEVLPVGRTKPHFAYNSHQFLVQSMDTQFDHGTLANLHDLLLDLLARFLYDLLDTGRMDTAIGHQPLQG